MDVRRWPARADRSMGIRNLVLVLGDQLTPNLSALAGFDSALDIVLMVEVRTGPDFC